jgi:translation initiation factor IF-2
VDAVIQKSHVLDGSELNVRKHIPPLAEATYPKQVFVSGFSIKTSEEAFRNYLEARCRIDVDKIIYGDIESTVIVIFKEQPGRLYIQNKI